MEWYSIDTAPTSGLWIIGAEWQKPSDREERELQVARTKFHDGRWRYESGCDWTPTHWVPPPPLPKEL